MNKDLLRKADFFLMIIISVLSTFGSVTGLQFLPFAIFALLGYMQIWSKKTVKLWIIILSALMILINLTIFSWVDIIAWLFTLIVFAI